MAGCGARIRQVRQSCFSGISCGNSCDTALGLSDADSCRRRYPEGRGSESVRAAAGISSVHEKQIRLEDETLIVTETIRNEGGEPADFTWTQHSAFGGSFLDEQVEISYPGEEIFLSSLYAGQGGKKEEYLKNICSVPMPDGTIWNLKNMREPGQDGHLIFTMKAETGDFALYHKARKFGFRVTWDKQVFPYIRCWYQNTEDGYSFAIEPCNYAYSSFADTDKENMYLHLDAGEEMSTEIRLSIIHENKG